MLCYNVNSKGNRHNMDLSEEVIALVLKNIDSNVQNGCACISSSYPQWIIDIVREHCNIKGIKLFVV